MSDESSYSKSSSKNMGRLNRKTTSQLSPRSVDIFVRFPLLLYIFSFLLCCRQTRVKINRSKGEIGRRVFGWMPPRPIAIRCYVCSVQTQCRRVHHCIIQDICTYSREKKRLSRSPLLFSLEGGEQETRGCSAFSYRDGQSFGIDRWTILHQHG